MCERGEESLAQRVHLGTDLFCSILLHVYCLASESMGCSGMDRCMMYLLFFAWVWEGIERVVWDGHIISSSRRVLYFIFSIQFLLCFSQLSLLMYVYIHRLPFLRVWNGQLTRRSAAQRSLSNY